MITLDTVTLHPDLKWTDEHNWFPVEQTSQRTITGALIVSSATRVAGRPITLSPENESSAWMSQSTLTALRNLAVTPGQTMTLTIQGVSRSVIFRHHDGAAIEAEPVIFYNQSDASDWFTITIRLMEI